MSATRLADGRWFLVGGESAGGGLNTASLWNPQTNNTTQLSATLARGRAWHSATMLPDGLVLILGGLGNNQQLVPTAELFDPATQSFTVLPSTGVAARARHSVTLLSDGHALITGGVGANGQTLQTAELWDALNPSSTSLPLLSIGRRNHTSTLLPDGRVLIWGGTDGAGNPLSNGELFDTATQRFTSLQSYPTNLFSQPSDGPILMATIPIDRSDGVPAESVISLRFSKPLRVETINAATVTLQGPKGVEKIKVVAAENGSLAFITSDNDLLPGSTYSVTINGAVDTNGLILPVSGLTFTTLALPGASTSTPTNSQPVNPQSKIENLKSKIGGDEGDELHWRGRWKDGKPYSEWQDLPPLQAPEGVTALAGQVLDLRGLPLVKVKLELESHYGSASVPVETDETGRFLITGIGPGWGELTIDGHNARRRLNQQSPALGPQEDHGRFEYGLKIKEGETLVLPFTIWLPKIDTAHAVAIPPRLTSEVVVTSPKLPGLEVRLPANAEIIDHEGKPVREVSLTQIPLDRTPFPLPTDIKVPIYFTAQPGGAYVYNPGGIGARIHYPNAFNELPGTRLSFWHYDSGYHGWYKYGLGIVPPDGKQIVPDPGISVYEFTGAMVGNQGAGGNPDPAPPECKDPKECKPGDPVDVATGLFFMEKSDLYLPDGTMPIDFKRTYRQSDTFSRAFGIGASHSYDMFFTGTVNPYTYIDLNLPDGQKYRFKRISTGTSYADAVYEHVTSRTRFYKAKISWNGAGWNLLLRDGTLMAFRDGFNATRPGQSGVLKIQDTNGNSTTITRDSAGNATRITAPGGRWISLTYDAGNRITQAQDNIGRTLTYEYDATGRLIKVTDPNGGTNEFTYDVSSRMLTLKDARGIVWLTNQYDATGKVIQQTMVDGGIYLFNYSMSGSNIIQTDITDPRGMISSRTFNSAGNVVTYTAAVGRPEEQAKSYNIQSGTNFVLSETDALNRTTSYTYDSMGNVTSVTRLSGTDDAVTTTATYEPVFNKLASVTDPLIHTTTFGYDAKGNLVTITNPLNQTTTITRNGEGQPTAITDALNNTTQYTYDFGDHAGTTDPLGNASTRFTDAAGRVLGVTDPLANISIYDYDVLNRLTKATDPISGQTNFTYDPNGNLLSVTDARSNATVYTYDNMDRLATRLDPLLRTESHLYDLNGNRSQFTDRKSQVATYSYDGLDRRTGVTYADTSTTGFTFDKGNRLTQVSDSIAGTITRTYDGLNRLTSETTPQGSVSYTYDAVGRRTSMTVAGQSTVNYSYDNANRLTQIMQGASTVTYTYDAVGRRTSLTLPNGVLLEYSYDTASRLTSITYKQNGTTVLGNLTYEYDKNGNRTKTGGSFARTGVPPAVASTAYNAANHQTTFGDKTVTYDNNGNLQTITDPSGTTTYTWNARNQLTGISGPGVSASFVYDGVGRREKKTINGNLTEFLYDGLNPVQETSGATILANILPGLGIDEFLTRTDVVAGVTSHFLTDTLGSPIAVTDNAGAVQTEYTYEPFGRTTFTGNSNSSSYQYTGRENDGTGLYYYRARFYHPVLQRFIAEDPLEFNGGYTNLYEYVNNSPHNYNDPLGLIPYIPGSRLPIPSLWPPAGFPSNAFPPECPIPTKCLPPPPKRTKTDPTPPKPADPKPEWKPTPTHENACKDPTKCPGGNCNYLRMMCRNGKPVAPPPQSDQNPSIPMPKGGNVIDLEGYGT